MQPLRTVSQLLREKQVSPVELLDAVLARIEADQARVNAYITVLAEESRKAAKAAADQIARSGMISPLHGIPVALKDLYYTKGVRTTAGSRILSDFVPGFSCTIYDRLSAAGAILVGKTNTHEFAYGPSAESSYYGPTRNPWDPRLISGGSSGGSGAAVATGMAYMAMGTDTGGSIRIPAALCGITGFKPTYGTLSLYGIVPLSQAHDHPGPMTRSVADIALTLDVISGYDEQDPYSVRWERPRFAGILDEEPSLAGVTVGVPTNYFWDKVDYGVEAQVRLAICRLAELGATVREINVPGAELAQPITTVLMSVEAAYNHREYLRDRPHEYQADVKVRLEKGFEFAGVDVYEAQKKAAGVRAAMQGLFHEVDVLALPSVPITAYEIGAPTVVTRGATEPAREMLTRHTRLGNLTGGPSLSVPCGFSGNGLPVGLQIMGDKFDDLKVLKVGYAYERLA